MHMSGLSIHPPTMDMPVIPSLAGCYKQSYHKHGCTSLCKNHRIYFSGEISQGRIAKANCRHASV